MTTAAWFMMLGAWAVIIFFTARFFLKILRAPMRREPSDRPPTIMGKDA